MVALFETPGRRFASGGAAERTPVALSYRWLLMVFVSWTTIMLRILNKYCFEIKFGLLANSESAGVFRVVVGVNDGTGANNR